MKKFIILLIILIIPLFIANTSLSANSKKRIDNFKTASREFIKNEDGTYTDVYYSKVINYYENGMYKAIDNSFIEAENGYTNKESNYKIKTPNILNNETNVTLDYYGDDLKLSFNDINDDLTGTIQRKINKTKRNINRVYSEKIKYSSDENSITFDNYTDSLRILIELQSLKNIKDFQISVSSENLIFSEHEDKINLVNKYNIVIFEIDKEYIVKTDDGENVQSLTYDDIQEGLSFYNELQGKDESGVVELNVTYTLNSSTNCIIDKHIISGLDYSYNEEYLKVGKNDTGTYKGIIGINLNTFSNNLYVYEAHLVYQKEAGANQALNIYEINNSFYGDITGLTVYDKELIDTASYSNGYEFDITAAFDDSPTSDDGRYIFEISFETETNKLLWLPSDTSGDLPYLELDYEDIENSYYGAALPYEAVTGSSMNCFGYALNINRYLQITNNGEWITEFDSAHLTEEEYQEIIIPATINIIEGLGISARILDNYDSAIENNEYRIALRCGCLKYNTPVAEGVYTSVDGNLNDDYHFLRQNNDGTWSHKYGGFPSEKLKEIYNPIKYNWPALYLTESNGGTEAYYNFYDSSICYIAITVDKN